ncbi:hypothetical protein ACP4OV_029516 [Aristida adscensionis]
MGADIMEAAGIGIRCNLETYVLKWKLNERQQLLVDASGLGSLMHAAGVAIDQSLLRAFCKLWSKETNTAHFHDFEMAPSLRDSAYILGVPVTGRVVTTGAVKKSTNGLCLEYLGRFPSPDDTRGSFVKLSWLYSKFSQLSNHPTDEEIMYSTRAYLLCLIGSNLLPGRHKGSVSPKYLPLLSDFEKIRDYAWGMAALAQLYKSLSLVVTYSSITRLSGSATLLMAWIYEYIPSMCPDMEDDAALIFPRVRRWMGSTIPKRNKGDSVLQKALSLLRVSDINWEPYKNMDPASIPKTCMAPDNVCFSRTWLISFNLREIYVPDRYARQFGKEQHSLSDNYVPAFQRQGGSRYKDWSLKYASEIKHFEQLVNSTHCDHTTIPATCHAAKANITKVEDTKEEFSTVHKKFPINGSVEMCVGLEGDNSSSTARVERSLEPHQTVALDPLVTPKQEHAAAGMGHCAVEGGCTVQMRRCCCNPAEGDNGELRWSERHCDQFMRPLLLLLWCGVLLEGGRGRWRDAD